MCKLKNIIALLSMFMLLTVNAYASEIELTSEIEHTCVYQQEYDKDTHWNVCKICGAISDKVEHNLDEVYAFGKGEDVCIYNQHYSDCKQCDFFNKVGYAGKANCELGNIRMINDNTDRFQVWLYCKHCNGIYQKSNIEPLVTKDGVEHALFSLSELPIKVIDKYGSEIDLSIYQKKVNQMGQTFNIEFDDNTEYVTVSGKFNIPQFILDEDTEEIVFRMFAYGVVEDSVVINEFTEIIPDVVERVGDAFNFKATVKLRNARDYDGNVQTKDTYGKLRAMVIGSVNTDTDYDVILCEWTDIHVVSEHKDPDIQVDYLTK